MSLPTLNALRFDTSGWTEIQSSAPQERRWRRSDAADGLSQHLFLRQPDLPSPLQTESLRDLHRGLLAEAGGAIVEVELETLDTLPLVRTIFKFPQKPSGMIYLASLTLPFRNFSYVIKVQCVETGITGVRDTIVLDREMKAGRVSFEPKGGLIGWAADPYDATFEGPVLRNRSEDEAYDKDFPGHPLSRARRHLREIKRTLRLDESAARLPRF